MANPEHLEILNQGVNVWNQWRESEDGKAIIPDLRNANLKGINLTKANLREVNFQNALLDDAKFFKANLTEANLRESSLQYADFRYANLIKTDFYRADIYKANFARVYFFEANFAKAIGIETVGLDLTVSDGYTLETINTPTEGSYFVSTRESSGRNQANLVFMDGIDWLAFLAVYTEVNRDIAVEIIEIKNQNNFLVVKVELPLDVDKVKIENDFHIKYERRERELYEQYKNELNAKDNEIDKFRFQCINLMKVLKYALEEKSIINNISNNSVSLGNVEGNVSNIIAGNRNILADSDIKGKSSYQDLVIFVLIFFIVFMFILR